MSGGGGGRRRRRRHEHKQTQTSANLLIRYAIIPCRYVLYSIITHRKKTFVYVRSHNVRDRGEGKDRLSRCR